MPSKSCSQRSMFAVMIFALLFGFLVSYFLVAVPYSSRKEFSGTVYASSGVAVSGAIVTASGSNGSGIALTNSLGQYSIVEGLKTGNYTVRVIAQGYLIKEVNNVSVTAGYETSNVNTYLNVSGGISGRVTDAVSGQPLQNIAVTATPSGGGTYGWQALTDVNGNYSIVTNLVTGTYNVTAWSPEDHIMKFRGGISVTVGQVVNGKDLALERSGTIFGRVLVNGSGEPLEEANVYAASDDGLYTSYATTNATGYYRISSGLVTGTYTVTATYLLTNTGYVENVNVIASQETNVDVSIVVSPPTPSGIITGKVTDTSSESIAGALVTAQGSAGFGQTYTDENGNYAISQNLGTGTYVVIASIAGYSSDNKTGISVTVSQTTSDVNFILSKISGGQSGRISGTITGDNNPIPEFQFSIMILLIATSAAISFLKVFGAKTARSKHAA